MSSFTVLLLFSILFQPIVVEWASAQDYGQCLNNHGTPSVSDLNAYETHKNSRLEFSIALFEQVEKFNPSENVFFSPMGIYNTLLLAFFNSAGRTERSLRNILFLPHNKDKTDILKAYTVQKLSIVSGRYKLRVHSANRLFVSINQTVKDCMAEIFYDEIEMVDFGQLEKTVNHINNWIAGRTNNQIQNMVSSDSISPYSQIVLANAAYFRGLWNYPFPLNKTKISQFILANSSAVPVTMMSQENKFNYWVKKDLGVEVLELPYEEADMSMFILLPMTNSPTAIPELLRKTRGETILEILKFSNKTTEMTVTIPKFTVDQTMELTAILESMGIIELFRPSADLSSLTGKPGLKLDRAIHKAKAVIDEVGTTAAAATVVFANRFDADYFLADHPFVYFIIDRRSNTFLFAGIFNSPEKVIP